MSGTDIVPPILDIDWGQMVIDRNYGDLLEKNFNAVNDPLMTELINFVRTQRREIVVLARNINQRYKAEHVNAKKR